MKSALTPLDFLARSAFVYRDKIAVVDGERRFTYNEFNQRVHRLASALSRIGVEPGDRVAVLAPNTLMALEPHFAAGLCAASGVALTSMKTLFESATHQTIAAFMLTQTREQLNKLAADKDIPLHTLSN